MVLILIYKGPSINYVVSLGGGEGGSPKDDLLQRPYFTEDDKEGRGSIIADFEMT